MQALRLLGTYSVSYREARVIVIPKYPRDIDGHLSLRLSLDSRVRFMTVTRDGYGRPMLNPIMRIGGNLVSFAPLKEPELFERIALRYNPYWSAAIQPQVLHHVANVLEAPPCVMPGTLLTTLMGATRTRAISIRPSVLDTAATETMDRAVALDTFEISRDWDELVQGCAAFSSELLPPCAVFEQDAIRQRPTSRRASSTRRCPSSRRSGSGWTSRRTAESTTSALIAISSWPCRRVRSRSNRSRGVFAR